MSSSTTANASLRPSTPPAHPPAVKLSSSGRHSSSLAAPDAALTPSNAASTTPATTTTTTTTTTGSNGVNVGSTANPLSISVKSVPATNGAASEGLAHAGSASSVASSGVASPASLDDAPTTSLASAASPSSKGFGLLNKFGINRRAKTASLSQLPVGEVLLESAFLVGPKKTKTKKRFVVFDSRTLFVYDSEQKTFSEDSLLLLFCFVRNDPSDRRSFILYNKSRELVFTDPDETKVALWSEKIAAAADKARAEELADGGIDPRELANELAADSGRSGNDEEESDEGGAGDGATTVHGVEVRKAGYLSKRNKRGKFKKRWIVLTSQLLLFYNDSDAAKNDETAKESLQLLFCSAKPATSSSDAPHGFSIFAKDQTHEFAAASQVERQAWLSAIQSASERLMLENLGQTVSAKAEAAAPSGGAAVASPEEEVSTSSTAAPSLGGSGRTALHSPSTDEGGAGSTDDSPRGGDHHASRPRALQDEVEELLCRPENGLCADCSSPSPEWCSVNVGLFVCIECSGVHRRLGAHISKVRSTTLDMLLPEHITQLRAWGNVKANEVWEALPIPEGVKPTPTASSDARSTFIFNKYQHRLYHSKSRSTTPRGAKAGIVLPTTAAELTSASGRRQLGEALLLLLSADVSLRSELRSRLLPDQADDAATAASSAAIRAAPNGIVSTSSSRKKKAK